MIGRFRAEAEGLLGNLVPRYGEHLRRGAVSFRPSKVETRVQSWRADDRRMHVDAFPSRPNRGERLLRVFTNVNLEGVPRVWRVGEPFEDVAQRFLPRVKPYVAWQAKALQRAARDQVAAQRVRPPDAAAARRHEGRPRLPEERAAGDASASRPAAPGCASRTRPRTR